MPELATKADIDVQRAEFDALRADFAGLRAEFSALEGRFEGLEGRFEGLEGRFEGLEGRFEGLRGETLAMEARLGQRLERAMHAQANRFIAWMIGVAGISLAAAGSLSRLG